jgi:hypothetical protein
VLFVDFGLAAEDVNNLMYSPASARLLSPSIVHCNDGR